MLEASPSGNNVNIAEIAHIVARSKNGPRGNHPLPKTQRDCLDNLIVLCMDHHTLIDNSPNEYNVERLRQFKEDHENLVASATQRAIREKSDTLGDLRTVREKLYSTLLPVTEIPQFIYGVETEFEDTDITEVKKEIIEPKNKNEMCPFLIKGGMLFCFQNLRYKGGPFAEIVGKKLVHQYRALEWWDDPDKMRYYIQLLNSSLNKLTGRKGMNLDKRHHRYYFEPMEVGQPRLISYRPLNQQLTQRYAVWQPTTRKSGLPKSYWFHRAVALRFMRINKDQWCLSIRPEMHITQDGCTPIESEKIGSKVTKKKSKMFNYDLLGEIQFWRDFLSDSKPRMIFSFGNMQNIIVSTDMMETEIEWPSIPDEYAKPFKNIKYEEDLFSYAELNNLYKELGDAYEDDGYDESHEGDSDEGEDS